MPFWDETLLTKLYFTAKTPRHKVWNHILYVFVPLRLSNSTNTPSLNGFMRVNEAGFPLDFPSLYIRYRFFDFFLMKTEALAQMGTASCCPGVRGNRYSAQLD